MKKSIGTTGNAKNYVIALRSIGTGNRSKIYDEVKRLFPEWVTKKEADAKHPNQIHAEIGDVLGHRNSPYVSVNKNTRPVEYTYVPAGGILPVYDIILDAAPLREYSETGKVERTVLQHKRNTAVVKDSKDSFEKEFGELLNCATGMPLTPLDVIEAAHTGNRLAGSTTLNITIADLILLRADHHVIFDNKKGNMQTLEDIQLYVLENYNENEYNTDKMEEILAYYENLQSRVPK